MLPSGHLFKNSFDLGHQNQHLTDFGFTFSKVIKKKRKLASFFYKKNLNYSKTNIYNNNIQRAQFT